MNKKLAFLLAAIVAVLLTAFAYMQIRIRGLQREVRRQTENVKVLEGKQVNYLVDDSIKVSQIKALNLSNKELKQRYSDIREQLNKVSNSGKKEATQYTQLEILRHDTLFIHHTDTVTPCVEYSSRYASVSICGDTAQVVTNDTLHQVVSNVYKHRFLWWKFGIESIEQDIWLSSGQKLEYDKFIRINK